MNALLSKSKTCLLLVLLSVSGNALAATLTSKVNRNQLSVNETLTLVVSYDEQVNSNQFDTSQLEADFDVLSMSPQSNSSVAMVNGSVTVQAKTAWNMTLAPKRVGRLTIPAFEIGNTRSQPIRINVSPASERSNNEPVPLSATISSNAEIVHIGEQILVKIELSSRGNVGNLNGSPLELPNADVQTLEQQQEQRLENGIERQVITINYAVFPTEPGTLTIPAQTYTGIEGNSRSVFSTLARRGKRIVARTPALNIEVQPAQNKANAAWFPASHVSINSKWSRDISNISVGEPVTRSVTIVAKGQLASVIPPITTQGADQTTYKSYQDQPQLDNQLGPNGVLSARVESQAIVPSVEGELILPAQKIDWWNTELDEWEEAILPAETLRVRPGQIAASVAPNNDVSLNELTNQEPQDGPAFVQESPWWKILAALFALLSMIQSYFIWRLSKQQRGSHSADPVVTQSKDETSAWKKLNQALKAGNADDVRQHLLLWARYIAPERPRLSLSEIVDLAESNDTKQDLSPLLTALDAQLYQSTDANESSLSADDYQKLSKALKQLKQERKNQQQQRAAPNYKLKPLYPS